MTPDEINAAIARTVMNQKDICGCGLHWIQSNGKSCGNPVSNYHDSLDAIVPVVRDLDTDERALVILEMFRLSMYEKLFETALATPERWSECYLKAKGLWK